MNDLGPSEQAILEIASQDPGTFSDLGEIISQGLINPSGLGLSIVTVAVMHHIGVTAVTILLHRSETHGSIELHPVIKNVMEGIVRLTSPIIPKEWVAAHKRHHKTSDQEGDPHSPQPFKWRKAAEARFPNSNALDTVMPTIQFVERYLASFGPYFEAIDEEYKKGKISGTKPGIVERFGPVGGLMLSYILLFGLRDGMAMMVAQGMLGRATVTLINGMGHGADQENEQGNYASNVGENRSLLVRVLLAYMCVGEEHHGNHHKNMRSPDIGLGKNFDLGYQYAKCLEYFGLAKINTPRNKA